MAMKKIIKVYRAENGKEPYTDWIRGLDRKNTRIAYRIRDRLHRIEQSGNFGDCKALGDGVNELRFMFGSGYRVYFGEEDNVIVLLLCGGDKSTQAKDIEKAKEYWRHYHER